MDPGGLCPDSRVADDIGSLLRRHLGSLLRRHLAYITYPFFS